MRVPTLISRVNSRLHLSDGVIDNGNGLDSVTGLVRHGNFELVTCGPEVIQGGHHVGLVGPRVFNENTTGGHESEGESEEEMSDI